MILRPPRPTRTYILFPYPTLLRSLSELVIPLRINERLLRTSVFRLVAQGWLQSKRHGRRSLYRLSALGEEITREASERIYVGSPPYWDGDWTLVILPRFGNGEIGRASWRESVCQYV